MLTHAIIAFILAFNPINAHAFNATEAFKTVGNRAEVPPRDESLPEKITLVAHPFGLKELRSILIGSWRMILNCDGSPIRLNQGQGTTVTRFYANGMYEEAILQGHKQIEITQQGTWNLRQNRKNELTLSTYVEDKVRLSSIKETANL